MSGFTLKYLYCVILKDLKSMKEILGIKYMSTKEAVNRYGYSQSWFQQRRMNGFQPKFVKIQNKGKVYYPVNETDEWFKKNIISSE
jgi:phage pi2 protein 07